MLFKINYSHFVMTVSDSSEVWIKAANFNGCNFFKRDWFILFSLGGGGGGPSTFIICSCKSKLH